ncbi:hypothetical protein ACEXQE_17055 [Herbiconiux sp. P17]|uniref:hypothetical protein n=1 Tax=Herbiconiux wuyangfengii TaxID=3342794 RepID=UPI0035B6F738
MKVRAASMTLLGTAVVALLMAGCVAPAPTPTPVPTTATPTGASATPTTTATVTPTPTTPPAPVFTADDPGTWLIDFAGIGPLKLGTSLTDIEAALPEAPDVCRPGVDGFFSSTIVAVAPDAAGPLSMALAQTNGQLADGEGPGHPVTAAGIGPGSTVDQLLAAYPDAESYVGYGDQTVYRITDGATWIHFQPYGGDVIRAVTVQENDTFPREYCG